MRFETSYGIIPLRQTKAEWEVLIIRHRLGHHYGFPKGHPIKGEAPQETAKRELFEETGLLVEALLPDCHYGESYFFFINGEKIHKSVAYFVAKATGSLLLQAEEISEAKWVPLLQADHVLTFPQAKSICRELIVKLATDSF